MSESFESYCEKLKENPNDKSLLAEATRICAIDGQWLKLADLHLELADLVECKDTESDYLHIAASYYKSQCNEPLLASKVYLRLLNLNSNDSDVFISLINIYEETKRYEELSDMIHKYFNNIKELLPQEKTKDYLLKFCQLYIETISKSSSALVPALYGSNEFPQDIEFADIIVSISCEYSLWNFVFDQLNNFYKDNK